ncbi:hypothetical protein D3C73_1258520 [compost metagenome]
MLTDSRRVSSWARDRLWAAVASATVVFRKRTLSPGLAWARTSSPVLVTTARTGYPAVTPRPRCSTSSSSLEGTSTAPTGTPRERTSPLEVLSGSSPPSRRPMWLLRPLTTYSEMKSNSPDSPNSATSGPSVTSTERSVPMLGRSRPSRKRGRSKYGWRTGLTLRRLRSVVPS